MRPNKEQRQQWNALIDQAFALDLQHPYLGQIEEDDEDLRALGGPGSGNFGHAGRPGEVGGSASSSGPRVIGSYGGAGKSRAELYEQNTKLSQEAARLADLINKAEPEHWALVARVSHENPGVNKQELAAILDAHPEVIASQKALNDLAEQVSASHLALDRGLRDIRMHDVVSRTQSIADEMDFDASRIDIVDQPPREFTVGRMQFEEAGHFDPKDGRIEINARQVGGPEIRTTTGVVAHEIAHAQYHAVNEMLATEKKALWQTLEAQPPGWTPTFENIEKAIPDWRERFPSIALWHDTWGDRTVTDQLDRDQKQARMIADDGVSTYSAAYWTADAAADGTWTTRERAINETLAEVRRMQLHSNNSLYRGEKWPSKEWSELARGIGELYAKRFGKKKS